MCTYMYKQSACRNAKNQHMSFQYKQVIIIISILQTCLCTWKNLEIFENYPYPQMLLGNFKAGKKLTW